MDQTRFLDLIFNFKQRGHSIVNCTGEGDQLNVKCPEIFRDLRARSSGHIVVLADKRKVDLVPTIFGGLTSKQLVIRMQNKLSKMACHRF